MAALCNGSCYYCAYREDTGRLLWRVHISGLRYTNHWRSSRVVRSSAAAVLLSESFWNRLLRRRIVLPRPVQRQDELSTSRGRLQVHQPNRMCRRLHQLRANCLRMQHAIRCDVMVKDDFSLTLQGAEAIIVPRRMT